MAAVRKADLVICSGAGLEVGWLPLLLQKAGGAGVQPGQAGNLMAADYVTKLDVPERVDRSDGDVHPEGNPHLHLNPHNIALVAAELQKRLAQLDAGNGAYYQQRYTDFSKRWNAAIEGWEKQGAALRGVSVVVHHKSLSYLLHWLGMREAATLEPKPGIPPTTGHLEALLQRLRGEPAKAILYTPHEPGDASQWLSQKTGILVLVMPYTVGGDAESADLFALFDRTLALLKGAVHG
jgi:zinc/manganese transport system substrate-binding protein